MKKRKKIISIAVMLLLCFSFIPQANANAQNKVTIPVSHEILGETGQDEVYEFEIEKVTENAPLPKNTKVQIKGDGSANFNIEFNDVGRYDYTIREIKGKTKSTQYDDTVYKVIVAATFDENHEITTYVVLEDGSNIKPEKVHFIDHANSIAYVTPCIKKSIKSNKGYSDKFRFRLKGKGVKKTVSVKGTGKARFPKLTFEKPGTYTFKVYELKDKKADWNYDKTKYKYKVIVTEKDNQLIAEANYDVMKFVNEPTFFKKVKQLNKNAQTGDNAMFGLIALAALFVFILLIAIRRRVRE